MYLHYSAISDVGRVRRENQDSGYAGPWLLTVCDGVGGAVRGDLASSTAVQALRKLDQEPDDDILGQVAGAVHRADDRIAELVEEDPALNGTSTTATVALFDGTRFGVGHIGDSRAYLYRRGELRQLTHDHTFVQSLIDEGRITEEQSRTHPHRNLILKALDGIRHEEPDLFEFPAEVGRPRLPLQRRRVRHARPTTGWPRSSAPAPPTSPPSSSSARASRPAAPTTSPASSPTSPRRRRPSDLAAPARRRGRRPAAPRCRSAARSAGCSAATAPATPARSRPCPDDVPAGAYVADPIDPEAARYAPRAAGPLRLARAGCWSPRVAARPGLGRARRRLVVEPAAVLRRRGRRQGHDLPRHRRQTCPASRSPTPTRSPTSSSTRLSDIDAEQVARGHRGRRPGRRAADRGQLRRAPGSRLTGRLR